MSVFLIGFIFALISWFAIYSQKIVGFWQGISVASLILAIWSVIWAGEDRGRIFAFKQGHTIWGILTGIVLYFVFWLGRIMVIQLFPSMAGQIDAIYANKAIIPLWAVPILLTLVAVCEEIFWRGMAQRVISRRYGANAGWLLGAIAYLMVNIWSANFVLIMTSLICGLYWGWLYKRTGSLWPGIISHVAWALAIFLLLPLQ